MSISRLLWAFDFKRAVDPVTKLEIFPNMDDLADGAFTQPGKMLELLDGDMQWRTVPEGLIWRDYEVVV